MTELKPTMPAFGNSPVKFFREAKAELLKVNWPTKDEVIKLSVVVVGVSLIFGMYIGGLDLVFTKLTNILIR